MYAFTDLHLIMYKFIHVKLQKML